MSVTGRSNTATLQSAASAIGNGTVFDCQGIGSVAFQVTGTFVGIVTFEGTIDQNNWVAIPATSKTTLSESSSANVPGIYIADVSGLVQVRARVSQRTSGTITVTAQSMAFPAPHTVAAETFTAPVGEGRALSTGGGGTALTTSAAYIRFPAGVNYITVTPRALSTAVVAKIAFMPFAAVLVTTDLLVTATDETENAQDGSVATDVTLSSLPTAANGGYLYVGCADKFRALYADVDLTNSTVSTLTAEYYDGTTWQTLTITDNTASAGATFAVDGTITWTVPTSWAKAALNVAVSGVGAAVRWQGDLLYWARFKVSAALDSSTTLDHLNALAQSSAPWEQVDGQATDMKLHRTIGGQAGLEATVDAGTGSLIVNGWAAAGHEFK